MDQAIKYSSSDQQSSQSDSSESENEGLTQEQIQEKQNQKRFKIIKAFRFQQQKQTEKMRRIFQVWRDESMMKQRANILISLRHYENKLLSKGLDGIIQYAMLSMSFKQKLVIFYYRYLISNCLQGWKQLHKQGELQQIKKDDKTTISKKIVDINKNVDQILEDNKKLKMNDSKNETKTQTKSQQKMLQFENYNKKQIKAKSTYKNQEAHKEYQLKEEGIDKIKQFDNKQRLQKIKGGFRAIQTFMLKSIKREGKLNNLQAREFVNQKYDEQLKQKRSIYGRYIQQSDDKINTNYGRHKTYTGQGFMTANQSRNNLWLDNSRRSVATAYNEINNTNQNKSQRKLRPVLEQVKLPSFGKNKQKSKSPIKILTNKLQQSSNQQPTLGKRKSDQVYKQSLQSLSRKNEETQKSRQYQQQKEQHIQRQKQLQKQQQKQKQKQRLKQIQKQKQKQRQAQLIKQKQNKVNSIISLITKGKIMQLSLINELPLQNQPMYDKYKKMSIETLSKIKAI